MAKEPSLHRVASILSICDCCINFFLLCIAVFEEVDCYLREECVAEYVFILLFVLGHFFFEGIQFIRNQVCRTACDDFCVIAKYFFLYFFVKWFYGCAVFSAEYVFCLFGCHLVAFAHQDVEYGLCSDDL